jgi:hypothetical protein
MSHHIGSYAQYSGSVLPNGIGVLDQPQVRFIHQCSWPESVISTLEAHFTCRQPM